MKESQPHNGEVEELVRRAQAGDEAAFERLARRFYARIQRWALARTADPDDADEVAQQVLLRLHRGLAGFDGRARFTTWLYQVTRTAAADLHRSRRRWVRLKARFARERTPEPYGPATGRGNEGPGQEGVTELVAAFFAELSGRQREVFDLVDLQGFTPAEVGRMLGLEAVTVRSHLFRARVTIRKRILEAHPELMEGYRS